MLSLPPIGYHPPSLAVVAMEINSISHRVKHVRHHLHRQTSHGTGRRADRKSAGTRRMGAIYMRSRSRGER